MKFMIQLAIALVALVSLGGCASAPKPTTYFLLRGEPVETTIRLDGSTRVGLGRVIVAPYLLTSAGIVLETGPGEINPASHHQWAEPLDRGLRWYLRAEIGKALGVELGGGLTDVQHWDYVINVSVARLHGTMSGKALIEAEFSIVAADRTQPTSEFRFAKSIPLPEEGYAGVVAAEKQLAKDLAGLIADVLRERISP
jgi:uncharacterized lipoprotein YmbA